MYICIARLINRAWIETGVTLTLASSVKYRPAYKPGVDLNSPTILDGLTYVGIARLINRAWIETGERSPR